jgi:adenylate cyclase
MEKNVAILMADLTGYTAMTDVHGGASAAKMVRQYMEFVDQSLVGTTRVVQRIGDQVVMISDNPLDIAHTARNLVASAHQHQFLAIHMGIHYGAIFMEGDNLFGSTINVASRIMNLAGKAQILCSSVYVNVLSNDHGLNFVSLGNHKLKNVLNEIEIFELTNSGGDSLFVDPVCHMLVDPVREHHTSVFQNQTFHFCSDHCRTLFNSSPETFVESTPR